LEFLEKPQNFKQSHVQFITFIVLAMHTHLANQGTIQHLPIINTFFQCPMVLVKTNFVCRHYSFEETGLLQTIIFLGAMLDQKWVVEVDPKPQEL